MGQAHARGQRGGVPRGLPGYGTGGRGRVRGACGGGRCGGRCGRGCGRGYERGHRGSGGVLLDLHRRVLRRQRHARPRRAPYLPFDQGWTVVGRRDGHALALSRAPGGVRVRARPGPRRRRAPLPKGHCVGCRWARFLAPGDAFGLAVVVPQRRAPRLDARDVDAGAARIAVDVQARQGRRVGPSRRPHLGQGARQGYPGGVAAAMHGRAARGVRCATAAGVDGLSGGRRVARRLYAHRVARADTGLPTADVQRSPVAAAGAPERDGPRRAPRGAGGGRRADGLHPPRGHGGRRRRAHCLAPVCGRCRRHARDAQGQGAAAGGGGHPVVDAGTGGARRRGGVDGPSETGRGGRGQAPRQADVQGLWGGH